MKDSIVRTSKLHWIFLILIFLYTAVLSYKLITYPKPFYDWDESIYVEVGKEMIVQHSPTPLWQGKAWLEKPPLAPLIYGFIIQYVPAKPEITTRLLSLFLSALALGMVYLWVLRGTKNKYLAITTGVLIACNPTFLQRAQTVNTDVFLLIGWLGYLLTFPRFGLSLLFLFIGVFSKSLLGFYPLFVIALYDVYRYVLERKYKAVLFQHTRMMIPQIAVMMIWYVIMVLFYGNEFVQVHFIDHMLRRVTSSIESHFGKRTYYFDLVVIQYGYYSFIALAGLLTVLYHRLKKKITDHQVLFILFLFPWFLFLNLTKTKISWYIYPAIPQIALLMLYPLSLIQKYKRIFVLVILGVAIVVIYNTYKAGNFLGSYYSEYDETYNLSQYAKKNCSAIAVLIDKDGRQTYEVLRGLNLTISTSAIYGNHPSLVYYSALPVDYVYNKNTFAQKISRYQTGTCLAIEDYDRDMYPQKDYVQMKSFDTWKVYRKN